MVLRPIPTAVVSTLFSFAASLFAAPMPAFRSVPLQLLEVTEGELPGWIHDSIVSGGRRLAVEVRLDGDGEAYLIGDGPQMRLVATLPHDGAVTGRLLVPAFREAHDMSVVHFRLPAAAAPRTAADEADDRAAFATARAEFHRNLASIGVPGAAWFRHRAGDVRAAPTDDAMLELEAAIGDSSVEEETYPVATLALFAGARAMSENLQLDRWLRVDRDEDRTVDVDLLAGITVREYDWTERVAGLEPALDPLASRVPADQHAIFFPSFRALVALADEADRVGTPILHLFEDQATDADTRRRYERQLLLPLNEVTRRLGPALVASVALTGSDPYLRTGSDVAVLFESDQPEALVAALLALRAGVASGSDAAPSTGTIGPMRWQGLVDGTRSICSYVARDGRFVIVTNSMVQLDAFAALAQGKRTALASLDEYRFFRGRYEHGADEETAFLILSDATIRRWCGPRWRIGASRRVRAGATLAEAAARRVDAIVEGRAPSDPDGTFAAIHGDLAFQTPIAELDLDLVTPAEARAYEWYRDRYQSSWRQYFDPIAVRIGVTDDGFTSDVSVIPLIANSEMRPYLDTAAGERLEPTDGDPHDDAVVHFVHAIDIDSKPLRDLVEASREMLHDLPGLNPLAWIGDHVALYVDRDPVLQEIPNSDDEDAVGEFIDQNFERIPVAFLVDVKNPGAAAAFLLALRTFAQQAAPDVFHWSTRRHGDVSYVHVAVQAPRGGNENERRYSIAYALLPDRWIVTPSEAVLTRAIDRAIAAAPAENARWNEQCIALDLELDMIRLLDGWTGPTLDATRAASSWRNLYVLNEWKRLFPTDDPVAVHERFFHQRIVCPGGGDYVWNERDRTMESTAYGSPWHPQDDATAPSLIDLVESADVTVQFEEDGVRARLMLRR